MNTLLVCLFSLVLFAPTAIQDKKSEDANSASSDAGALVYIYRYKQFTGGALEPSVYCDGKELARMDNGRYFKVKLTPGKHAFRSNDKQSGIEFETKAGEEYYIRVDIATGFWKGHGRLTLLQKEQGSYEVKKLQPLAADKIKDKTLVIMEAGVEKKEDKKAEK